MFDTIFSSLGLSLVVFVVAAAVITVLGIRLSTTADRLASASRA